VPLNPTAVRETGQSHLKLHKWGELRAGAALPVGPEGGKGQIEAWTRIEGNVRIKERSDALGGEVCEEFVDVTDFARIPVLRKASRDYGEFRFRELNRTLFFPARRV
jgi:hypothetical protein